MSAYIGLFFTAFVAATLLPAQSEAVLLGLIYLQKYSVVGLIIAASMGNILGSCVNWYLGTQIERFREHRYFPFSVQQIDKAQTFYQKYGWWSLFLSWLPIIGDPLTLIAGILKEKLWRFVLVVSIAKTLRYVVIYVLYLYSI
ncbi:MULTISPECIES: YqaA family protein [unclassified Acinetobacter]|uniref:YqaA family protein n=1 Tax=unclassified Acinetobacter TaxID=196816 RepID=UPI0035B9DFDD